MSTSEEGLNNDKDSSCFIVESNVEVIEILSDTLADEVADESKNLNLTNESISGYLVIDETGNDSNLDETIKTNGDGEVAESCEDPILPIEESAPKTPESEKSNNKSEHRTLIDIKFQNKKTYFAFHEEFIDIIKKKYRSKIDDIHILDDSNNHRVCITEKIVKKSQTFLIDATPTTNESTPRYNALNTPVLSNTKEPQKSEKRMLASNNKCFNCDGDHALRECPEPRNMGKIRKARNDFNRRELRYHDDDNNEYSQLIPGAISDELKEALRLVENEIPLHVYKMRVHGYPPAWLEEAKIQQSGLALFTGNENEKSNSEVAIKYDVQKIYDFPGFNVAPEGQFVDKSRLFGLPPMLPQHSKEFLIQSLGDNIVNGYKKRKINDTNELESTSCEEVEMEIADDDEDNSELIPLGKTYYSESILPPGVSEPSPEDGECSNGSSVDLEEKKKALMSQLAAEDEKMSKSCIIENSLNENNDNSSRDDTKIGHVETTVFGTPVLPSFSPFESLPKGDAFMAGVSDVIAFENLAESTGKYENMRELIKKVRIFQHKHQHE